MSAATLTIPASQWRKVIKHIEATPTDAPQSTAGWVKLGKILEECPTLTEGGIRGMRKTHKDLVKEVNKRCLYYLPGFLKCA